MKKALMLASVPSMIGQFNMGNIEVLQDMGYEVHVGCNFEDRSVWTDERVELFKSELRRKNIQFFQIDFSRSAKKMNKHIRAYGQVKDLLHRQKYDIMHCHTPIAGMLSRLASKKMRKEKMKVVYTAHGFHFYKGASIINWLLFFPIEKIMAYYTDALITINHEDYTFAKKHFNVKEIEYIPGVGIDIKKYNEVQVNRDDKRAELCIAKNSILLLSVGELNENKNHQLVIRALAKMKKSNIHYAIAGAGDLGGKLNILADKLGVEKQVHLLGYRKDIPEILKCADIFVFPSKREGLPVSLMEAIACKLPVICSNIRGNTDLVLEEGCLFETDDVGHVVNCLQRQLRGEYAKIVEENYEHLQQYDMSVVMKKMRFVYGVSEPKPNHL